MTPNEHDRWIEIKFAYLCNDLYNRLKSYPFVMSYIEVLAELANVEKSLAIRTLQNITSLNRIRPSKTEYICLAKLAGVTINQILEALQISKRTYIDLYNSSKGTIPFTPQSNQLYIKTMEQLLEAHEKIKGAGI